MSHETDRWAFAVITAFAGAMLWISLAGHPTPLYDVETDLIGDYIPAAKGLLAGHFDPHHFEFRGPGYPVLLAATIPLTGGDAYLAARMLNVAAAAAAAAFAYLLIRAFLGGTVALGTLLALVANPVFVRASIEAASDMPAAAIALAATWLAVEGRGMRALALSGLLAGWAVITRYNFAFLPAAAAIAVLARRKAARSALPYAAGFALPVGGWMLAQAAASGTPLANPNYLNLAFEVYGKREGWEQFWGASGGRFHSYLDVARYDPVRFATHLATNLATRWLEDARWLMPVWIGAFAVPGMLFTWWKRERWAAMLAAFLGCYAVLSLVFYAPRFFIYLLPFYLSGVIGLLLLPRVRNGTPPRVPPRMLRVWRTAGPLAVAILVAASAMNAALSARRLLAAAPHETRLAGAALRALASPGESVMARKPHVAYFAGLGYVPLPDIESIPELFQAASSTGARYLFVSKIEAELRPPLEMLVDSGVSLPGLEPVAFAILDSTRYYALYRFSAPRVTRTAFEESLVATALRFVARRPGAPGPLSFLAGTLMEMGRFREALGPLREAARLAPSDERTARFEALAHSELGELDEAAAACERSLRLGSDDTWATAFLGHLRLQQGRAPEARDLLRRAVERVPASSSFLRELGLACFACGDWSGAAESFERGLRVEPTDATMRLFGARAWLRLGDRDRARSTLAGLTPAAGDDAKAAAALADSLAHAH